MHNNNTHMDFLLHTLLVQQVCWCCCCYFALWRTYYCRTDRTW